jgi:glycosyltransferase involved in cell wall biosynthesis
VALAAGLPCLLSNGVAIATEVAAAGAGAAVNCDAASVAQGLRQIFCNETQRLAMASNARRLAQERFSSQAMGKGLKQLYTNILK